MMWGFVLFCASICPPDSGCGGDRKPPRDEERVEGKWIMVYQEVDGDGGKPTNKSYATFEKGVSNTIMGEKVAVKTSFRLDAAKMPKTIDFTILDNTLIPESKGKTLQCIYDFDDNGHLRICYPENGRFSPRPAEMSTRRGRGGILEIYEKVREKN